MVKFQRAGILELKKNDTNNDTDNEESGDY